jgi:transketolase
MIGPSKAVTFREGSDVTLISNGGVRWRGLATAKQLEDDSISARLISMPMVKPPDTRAVLQAARETRGLSLLRKPPLAVHWQALSQKTVVQNHPGKIKILGLPEFAIQRLGRLPA